MKITITDNEGKTMVFETFHPVKEVGDHSKIFICEEWILIGGTKMSKWLGYKNDERSQFYTKEDVLKAGEMGEVNHHDVKHIISYLDEAKYGKHSTI
jgi:hypothetical protein